MAYWLRVSSSTGSDEHENSVEEVDHHVDAMIL
jgi:hypothetical protein